MFGGVKAGVGGGGGGGAVGQASVDFCIISLVHFKVFY